MIDIALIREKPDWVKEQIAKLNDEAARNRIDAILALDQERRTLITEAERIQATRNKLNKSMGMLRSNKALPEDKRLALALQADQAIAAKRYEDAVDILGGATTIKVDFPRPDLIGAMDKLMAALRGMGNTVDAINTDAAKVESQLNEHLYWLPNLPHESVPVAPDEGGNIAHPAHGELPEFDFQPKAHWDLGPALGIIDFERGVKLHGSRGYVLMGWGARLQRALISFFLDQARESGFTEVYVPYMVQQPMMFGAGQFPKFMENVYYDPEADLYMIPTAEVAVTNLHRDEILDEAQLPLNYIAHSPCFRKEKASAGKDTRGMKRVHQFEKVEMYKFTTPETSYAELEQMTRLAENLCAKLELPYRRLEIVTGDLGFSATKKYDVEVWSAGTEEWLEVSSISNTESFQARRANVKYRPAGEKKTQFVHTLNGSGLATPRVMIAIMENNQQEDGSVLIPAALRPYLGGAERITKA